MTKQTQTMLMVGGAVIAVYLLTKPKTVQQPAVYYNPAAYNPYTQYGQPQNTTSSIISASGSALSSILKAISDF